MREHARYLRHRRTEAKYEVVESPPGRAEAPDAEAVRTHQARRLESARRAFLREFCISGKAAGSYELFERERKILTVEYRDVAYVPSFQFDEKGCPRPAVAKVIEILGKDTSDWGMALVCQREWLARREASSRPARGRSQESHTSSGT